MALRRPRPFTPYGDVALSATILRDEDLVSYLEDVFLAPLTRGRDEGETLRETLRAYFASDQNASSTGYLLGISRQTVTSRLRVVEKRLDRTLATCRAELEAALTVESLRG